jgi:hypothetical protein
VPFEGWIGVGLSECHFHFVSGPAVQDASMEGTVVCLDYGEL